MLLLGAAVRFVHFALFEATLLSPASYAADTLYLLLVGALAWRMTRAAQMATQYYWLYERTGPLTWRERTPRRTNFSRNTPTTVAHDPVTARQNRTECRLDPICLDGHAAGATMRSEVRSLRRLA